MRALLRVLAPLLGLALAAAGVLLVIEVVAAWLLPPTRPPGQDGPGQDGVAVPWRHWRSVLEDVTWQDRPVFWTAVVVGAIGLLLVLVGVLARRSDVAMDGPRPGITVTTSPRVLAQLVGRRVRAIEEVAGASVTASRRRISVSAQGWDDAGPELRQVVRDRVEELLEQLRLDRRPSVSVSVHQRRGPR